MYIIQAIRGGLCSVPPDTITRGVEFQGCAGTETNLYDCQSSEGTCSLWAGIICTCELLYYNCALVLIVGYKLQLQ